MQLGKTISLQIIDTHEFILFFLLHISVCSLHTIISVFVIPCWKTLLSWYPAKNWHYYDILIGFKALGSQSDILPHTLYGVVPHTTSDVTVFWSGWLLYMLVYLGHGPRQPSCVQTVLLPLDQWRTASSSNTVQQFRAQSRTDPVDRLYNKHHRTTYRWWERQQHTPYFIDHYSNRNTQNGL